MIHLVSHYYPLDSWREKFASLTLAHNESVAKKHGWTFTGDMDRHAPGHNVLREKAAILCEVIAKGFDEDLILWVDGDAVILTPSPEDIFVAMGSADMAMAKDHRGEWNSGTCAFRCSDEALAGWHKVMIDKSHGDMWHDYPKGLDIAELGASWNDQRLHDDTRILHTYGTNGILKYKLIKEALSG